MIVTDLAGSYNDFGIRRWFRRARAALGGKTPVETLSGDRDPDSEAPRKVRELAGWLTGQLADSSVIAAKGQALLASPSTDSARSEVPDLVRQ